jgi:hypothetical protein
MLRFAKEIVNATGVPIAIIPGPKGGACLLCTGGWARNASNPLNRATLYGSMVYRGVVQAYAHPIRGVIWYQGESDALQDRTTAQYLSALQALLSGLRGDLANPNLFFGNVQLSTWNGTAEQLALHQDFWVGVQEAQRQQVLSGTLSTVVSLLDVPNDGIHLTADGYKEAGRRLGLATLRDSYAVGSWSGPRLVGVCLAFGRNDRIEITYDKDVTGGGAALYRVTDAGAPVAVSSVSTTGATVTLQLAQPLNVAGGCCPSTSATVSYGYGTNAGLPWVRAADGTGGALAFRAVRVGP